MSGRCRLTRVASAEVTAIGDYLEEEAGTEIARHVIRRLRDVMSGLASMPGKGHRRTDLTDRPVLFWAVYRYLIVYREVDGGIEVVRVVHSARDVARELDDEAE